MIEAIQEFITNNPYWSIVIGILLTLMVLVIVIHTDQSKKES